MSPTRPLVLACFLIAAACNQTLQPSPDPRPARPSVTTDAIQNLLVTPVRPVAPTPTEPTPPVKAVPTYTLMYEGCLMSVAGAGGAADADRRCDGFAQQISGSPRPTWSPPLQNYFRCLLGLAESGTYNAGDFRRVCHGPFELIARGV